MQTLTRADLKDSLLIENLEQAMISETGAKVLIDEPLSKHTSWRIGGPAKLYAYPVSLESLCSVIKFCNHHGLETFSIGYGTNLLASDEGFAGCVIDLADAARYLKIQDQFVTCGGGVWLGELVRSVAESGLKGMERLAGIPGGVGGALAMNAGAFGMSISDHLTEVRTVDAEGAIQILPRNAVNYGYRTAPGLVGRTVFDARFELHRDYRELVVGVVEETINDRFRRNVMTLPSAGSLFKNPEGGFAAKMIEAVGGKGLVEGGVEVSQLHANFVVNQRGGTAMDILNLIRRIRKLVRNRFGATLNLEVRLVGFEGEVDLG